MSFCDSYTFPSMVEALGSEKKSLGKNETLENDRFGFRKPKTLTRIGRTIELIEYVLVRFIFSRSVWYFNC